MREVEDRLAKIKADLLCEVASVSAFISTVKIYSLNSLLLNT